MKSQRRVSHHPVLHVWAITIFVLVVLALGALVWMGVTGTRFPRWLLALTTVL